MIASVVLSQLIDVCQSRLTAESRVLVRSEITVVETVAAQIVADTLSAVRASLEPVGQCHVFSAQIALNILLPAVCIALHADGPRDAMYQSKSCQLSSTTNPQQIE